jgi:hypothetical protein
VSGKRPNQNKDGQAKKPSANPDGQAKAAPPSGAPAGPPNTAPNGALKSNLAHPPLPPMTAGGTGGDLGMLQTRVNFRDLPPPAQSQVQEQMGIDPYAMLKMGQQQVDQSAMEAQGGNQPANPMMPNALSGPGIDPSAQLDNFPHDANALLQHMQAGYAPGADAFSHAQAQNAHSIARAQEVAAQQNAQNAGAHQDALQQLAALMQKLHLHGQLPHPDELAAHVMAQQGPPQMASQLAGPTG